MIPFSSISHLDGWLEPQVLPMVEQINKLQTTLYGNIAEIGIHHGKFFIPLASCLKKSEYGFAIDLFEKQSENISQSGAGNLSQFSTNLAAFLPETPICILKENSLNVKKTFFSTLNSYQIRLFSIDGGHHYREVENDLAMASSVLHTHGIIIVDDFQHIEWNDVYQATLYFLKHNDYLPVAMGGNKLLLCNTASVNFYQSLKGLTQDEYFKTIINDATKMKTNSIVEKYPHIVLFPEQQYLL